MLTRDQAQKIVAKALSFSKFPETNAGLSQSESAFVRFANNGITTSGFTLEQTLSFSATREGKTGSSSTSDLSDEAIKAAVKRAEELSQFAPPNPERVLPLGPQKYADSENFDEQTARARAPQLIAQIKPVVDGAMSSKLVSAGFFDRTARVTAFANSNGNVGYQRSTDSRLTTTVRTADGSSSGWAGQPSVRIGEIDGKGLASRAIEKCVRWSKPVRLDPGKYTVVLEPTAVSDLLNLMETGFSTRLTEEGRSFLSKRGGGSLVGEKFFPDTVTLRSDAFDKRFPTALWSNGGLPNRPITWIDRGVVRNTTYDRYYATKASKEPTPPFDSLILEEGLHTLGDLVKATERGLLVTRFWYIRMVNPQTLQATGLTRDGLFLIENGKVTQPAMNFRFNESPVRMLQNATMLGKSVRAGSMVVPPIQSKVFNFTSISDAV